MHDEDGTQPVPNEGRTLVILGAGASRGYDSTLTASDTPPATTGILEAARDVGILGSPDFNELRSAAYSYALRTGNKSSLRLDFELFLTDLADRYLNAVKISDRPSIGALARILSEAWYFLFDLFRRFGSAYTKNGNAYHLLALHAKRQRICVISLNYDVLFELALIREGVPIAWLPSTSPLDVPFAKLHGSVSWLNPAKGAVQIGSAGVPLTIRDVAPFIYSNTIVTNTTAVLPVLTVHTIPLQDLLQSGSNWAEPLIVPPLANHRRISKFQLLIRVEQFARQFAKLAPNVVVIGTQLRSQDKVICDIVKDCAGRGASFTFVGKRAVMASRIQSLAPGFNLAAAQWFDKFDQWTATL
jgi:hypothetical protein